MTVPSIESFPALAPVVPDTADPSVETLLRASSLSAVIAAEAVCAGAGVGAQTRSAVVAFGGAGG